MEAAPKWALNLSKAPNCFSMSAARAPSGAPPFLGPMSAQKIECRMWPLRLNASFSVRSVTAVGSTLPARTSASFARASLAPLT